MMNALHLTTAAGILGMASAAQARMPVFLEIGGVEGETEKKRPKPQSAPAQQPQPGIAAPVASQRGGVNVAVRDVNGDGRGEAALLLPAVQKVRAAEPAQGNTAPRHIRQGTMTTRKQGGRGD